MVFTQIIRQIYKKEAAFKSNSTNTFGQPLFISNALTETYI